jgi:hypothetical protein
MASKERAKRRAQAPQILLNHSVLFERHNNGAHLVCRGRYVEIDYWPGPDMWKVRGRAEQQHGINELIRYLEDL